MKYYRGETLAVLEGIPSKKFKKFNVLNADFVNSRALKPNC